MQRSAGDVVEVVQLSMQRAGEAVEEVEMQMQRPGERWSITAHADQTRNSGYK